MTAQHGREKAEEVLGVIQDVADDLLTSHGEEAVEAFWKTIAKRGNRQMQGYADERRRQRREEARREIEARLERQREAMRVMPAPGERLLPGTAVYQGGQLIGVVASPSAIHVQPRRVGLYNEPFVPEPEARRGISPTDIDRAVELALPRMRRSDVSVNDIRVFANSASPTATPDT